MILNLRTLNPPAFQGASARATAVDSPSSEQVREACQLKGDTAMKHNCGQRDCACDTGGESVSSDRSVCLEPSEILASLRAHRIVNFAEFLEANWPAGLSEDCAANEAGTDCIELDLREEQYCLSCATYASICREWYASPYVQNRRIA